MFTAAGNQPGTTAASAVSKVAGVAFTGSLIGPPLIGLIAELTSLRTALFTVAVAARRHRHGRPAGRPTRLDRRTPTVAVPGTQAMIDVQVA